MPFEQPANHTERCRERIEQELEKEPEGDSKVARDRESQASQADMRIEDPDQRPDRRAIEGTGASSSRDGAGNEPPPCPAESSSVDQRPREQSDEADVGDPESDRRRPREPVVEEREAKRVRINVLDGEERDEWVETEEEEWVRVHRRPRDLFSPHDSQGGPKLSDISTKKRVHSLQRRRRRTSIVDRWGDKETFQDLPQEWTGSTRLRKSWAVVSEQTQPPAEDFSPDVMGDILDLRPTSQQGKRWNLCDPEHQREILWLICKNCPKLVIGYGRCILPCTVLYHEQIRRGVWFLHDLGDDASQLCLPCIVRLECRHDVLHALGCKDPNVEKIWTPKSQKVFGNKLATWVTHPP